MSRDTCPGCPEPEHRRPDKATQASRCSFALLKDTFGTAGDRAPRLATSAPWGPSGDPGCWN